MFGTIYYLYVLSMFWTLLNAQQNRSNLCELSEQDIFDLKSVFSIGNRLYVRNGTVFYTLQGEDLQNTSEALITDIFPGECFNRLFTDHKIRTSTKLQALI